MTFRSSSSVASAALRQREERHDDDAERGEHDSDRGVLHVDLAHEREHRDGGDVGGEGEERHGDNAQRALLPALGVAAGELPGDGGADRTSIVESSPNPISAADEATVPAVMATMASMRL